MSANCDFSWPAERVRLRTCRLIGNYLDREFNHQLPLSLHVQYWSHLGFGDNQLQRIIGSHELALVYSFDISVLAWRAVLGYPRNDHNSLTLWMYNYTSHFLWNIQFAKLEFKTRCFLVSDGRRVWSQLKQCMHPYIDFVDANCCCGHYLLAQIIHGWICFITSLCNFIFPSTSCMYDPDADGDANSRRGIASK